MNTYVKTTAPKKIIALLLALCLALGLVPGMEMGVRAAAIDASGGSATVSSGTGNSLDIGTLTKATVITVSGSGTVLTVTGTKTNATYNITFNIATGATVVWEDAAFISSALNAVSVDGTGTFTMSGGSITGSGGGHGIYNGSSIVIVSGGTVTGTGSTVGINNGSGTVTVSGGTITGVAHGIYNSGTVEVSGTGTVTATGSGGLGITNASSGTVTVSGGTVKATVTSGGGISNQSTGTVTVSGGTVEGTYFGVYKKSSGTVVVSGGTIKSTGSGIRINNTATGTVTVNGTATVVATEETARGINNLSSSTVNISGTATVVATGASGTAIHSPTGTANVSGRATVIANSTLTSGTVTFSENAVGFTYATTGAPYRQGTSTGIAKRPTDATVLWDIKPDGAGGYKHGISWEYDGDGASSIAANTGFYELSGITHNEVLNISTLSTTTTKTVAAGSTLYVTGTKGSTGAPATFGITFDIATGAAVVWEDAAFISSAENAVTVSGTGTFTMTGGSITATGSGSGIYNDSGTVIVSGGTVTGTGGSSYGIYNYGDGDVTVSDGMVTATGENGFGIGNLSTADVTVSGGTITAVYGGIINNSTGDVTVSGGTITTTFIGIGNNTGTATVSGGTIVVTGASGYGIANVSTGDVTVSGTATVISSGTLISGTVTFSQNAVGFAYDTANTPYTQGTTTDITANPAAIAAVAWAVREDTPDEYGISWSYDSDGASSVAANAGFYEVADVRVRYPGSAIAAVPAVASTSNTAITVSAATLTTPTGQTIEYAISGSGTVVPTANWGTSLGFSGLTSNTTYYVWARAQANADYAAGTPSPSAGIPTDRTDAALSPATASYNKNGGGDITITLTPGDYTLSAIKNGDAPLTLDTEYTVSSNIYTIKSTYLDELATGTHTLTFDMSGGADPVVAITVSDTRPTVSAVTVTPAAPTIVKGGSQQFAATVAGTYSPAQTVTWSVSPTASGSSISTSGLLTVAEGETASALTVTATSVVDTTKSGTATVTVALNDAQIVAADKAALGWDSIKGENTAISAVISALSLPASGAGGTSITWASSDTAIAADGTVTRPPYADGDKVVTLTATISIGAASDTKPFTITIAKLAASNDASLSALTISAGTLSPAFAASTATYTAAVPHDVESVTISAAANHEGASITGDTGEKSLSVGDNAFTITVTAQDATATMAYTLTITRAAAAAPPAEPGDNGGNGDPVDPAEPGDPVDPADPINPIAPTVTPAALTLTAGGSGTLHLTLGTSYSGADISSSDTALAAVTPASVSADGDVQVSGVAAGNVVITITFTGGTPSYSVAVPVIVSAALPPVIEPPIIDSPSDNSSSSAPESGSAPSAPAPPPNAPAPVTTQQAAKTAQEAVREARTTGADTASITLKNPGEIGRAALESIAGAANSLPGGASILADSLAADSKAVLVRIKLDVKEAASDIKSGVIKALNLAASLTSTEVKQVETIFNSYFTNDKQAVHFEMEGIWGQPVEVAVKLDPHMDTGTFYFYSYDKKTNRYTRLPRPNYWIDAHNYVHFTTEIAGDILISEGELESK